MGKPIYDLFVVIQSALAPDSEICLTFAEAEERAAYLNKNLRPGATPWSATRLDSAITDAIDGGVRDARDNPDEWRTVLAS